MTRQKRNPDDLGRLELLRAWLGLWKPRDVEVPPVPKRRLAVLGAVLVVILAAVAAVAIPAIDSSKDEGAEREARETAEARAAERRRLEAEQAAHHGRGPSAPDQRDALLARVEASIGADARRRIAAGELDGRVLRVECRPDRTGATPETALQGSRGSYDCTAITREILAAERNVPGVTGYPFIAIVDFATGRYTWCKVNPIPGERLIPDPRDIVALPKECVL